jgi:hypothetical protein
MATRKLLVVLPSIAALLVFVGCAVTPDDVEDQDETSDALTGGTCAGNSVGPCAGQPIDAAVRCATARGARVISYFRSAAQQECVRRQNGCTNRCSGSAGCARPTASCTGSPHTQCRAVDFANDGAPLTRAQLRECGLAKTTAPHANHYDLVGAPASTPPPANDPQDDDNANGCTSATLGRVVPPGTCVRRSDNSWYVCDARDLSDWPEITDSSDPQCTSCPQLPGGVCNGSSSGGKGGK